jgi:hypothetical protein
VRLTCLVGSFLVPWFCSSCHEAPDVGSVHIEVSVAADPGVPLDDVPVYVDGEPIGRSNAVGELRATIRGRPGQLLRFDHDCPRGHRPPTKPVALRLRSYRARKTIPPIEVELRCRPELRLAVFVVRATNGPSLPVLLDGELVGRTNRLGIAHFSKSVPAGSELLVQLDASARPALLPRRASHVVTVPDSHELFVINQSFEILKAQRRPRVSRHRIIKIE